VSAGVRRCKDVVNGRVGDVCVAAIAPVVNSMADKVKKTAAVASLPTALDLFFRSLESRTSDATHRRLLKAAREVDSAAALERELSKIMEELLHEA
jgi:hypothetical protein